jgi:predicted N-acyltransferase
MGNNMRPEANDYVIRVVESPLQVDASQWDALLYAQSDATPFMQHAYLSALHISGCATPRTGWSPRFMLLERQGQLVAACALYIKTHSRGEYVFDFGWANAYAQHGLAYYPKAVLAVPFTPVPGARLLARTAQDRALLAQWLIEWCEAQDVSGLHCLFANEDDLQACAAAGMMQRHTVQFHWQNSPTGYADFDSFLASLAQDKRKKIRQERRKVVDAGVSFRQAHGRAISDADWDFFYRCYERTYLEHGNAPYLNRAFFAAMAADMPDDWLLFTAERSGQPIATSLIAVNAISVRARGSKAQELPARVAYGRYWGALERVDCLHFEACYYQPLAWCIANGYTRFEGGAQGEHKLARALLPVKTTSAHWLAHPGFASAVNDFLSAEEQGMAQYMDELKQHSPFKAS